ncbi:hypothetical protein Dimus_006925 [Dionaea muscipula]
MIKLVKKRADMQVRDKVLVLLDSWQEAFGGPGGRHSQYYWAYDELRRYGVQFPPRSLDSAPIFTPPASHPSSRQAQASLGMPINSSTRLDEAMAAEVEGLSISSMESTRNAMDLLSDMLQAVNPGDRTAVKDEVIADLVDRCRANQKKLMQMLTTTVDEDLLAQGLELNDALQGVLAKHDAIASGTPLLTNGPNLKPQPNQLPDSGPNPNGESYTSKAEGKKQVVEASSGVVGLAITRVDEEEEEEDEFAELARRHSKAPTGTTEDLASSSNGIHTASESAVSNALALPDPPTPVKTTKEQDMIDLLSIVLSTSTTSPEAPQTPKSDPPQRQIPVSSGQDPYTPPGNYSGNPSQQPFNSYVVPWAQPQPQPQPQPHMQPGYSQYSSAYPPPPWASTVGYGGNQNFGAVNHYTYQHPGLSQNQQRSQVTVNSSSLPQGVRSFQNPQSVNQQVYSASQSIDQRSMATQGVKSLQHTNSFPAGGGTNELAMNGEVRATTVSSLNTPAGPKPFVPSYRLFEDLNVFGNADGKLKSGPYPSASGNPSQSMVGGGRR